MSRSALSVLSSTLCSKLLPPRFHHCHGSWKALFSKDPVDRLKNNGFAEAMKVILKHFITCFFNYF
jgi:hypothetical protein